jgi:hypothetical protein
MDGIRRADPSTSWQNWGIVRLRRRGKPIGRRGGPAAALDQWGTAMSLPRYAPFAVCFALFAATGASAQQPDDKWGSIKPLDLKPLIAPLPPVLPVPKDMQFSTGTAGTSQTFQSPMQNPNMPATQSGAGLKFSIPTK